MGYKACRVQFKAMPRFNLLIHDHDWELAWKFLRALKKPSLCIVLTAIVVRETSMIATNAHREYLHEKGR